MIINFDFHMKILKLYIYIEREREREREINNKIIWQCNKISKINKYFI